MARNTEKQKKAKGSSWLKKLLGLIIVLFLVLTGDYTISNLPNDSDLTTSKKSIVETIIEYFLGSYESSSETDKTENNTGEAADNTGEAADNTGKTENNTTKTENNVFSNNVFSDSKLEVYFFDVGQADSVLLLTDGKAMLVDTGNAGDADKENKLIKEKINLTYELNRLGVTRIDKLVLTHPHEDHMGSAYKIISAFDIEELYMNPIDIVEEYSENGYYGRFIKALEENEGISVITPTTLSEEEIIAKIEEYNANIKRQIENGENEINERLEYNASDYVRVSDVIDLGNAKVTVLAPNSANYSDINDYSIVLMVEFEGVKLLLTGDAGKESEEEMLSYAVKNGIELDCDILKVGHHGSRTASTEEFITAVKPEYAIVMVAEKNSYGLPDEDVIERLENHGAVIYQTKDEGDIKLTIDNGKYEFDLSFSHMEKDD